ncbi:hypothetical protein TNCV_824071 [Trichonephila clavipes]|nr:hypothetical protein TNCV_824071 [Trichonephila clavipes]
MGIKRFKVSPLAHFRLRVERNSSSEKGPSCRSARPIMWLVEEEERWEASDYPWGIIPQNWDGTKNRTVTCMVLIAMDNDRCTTSP